MSEPVPIVQIKVTPDFDNEKNTALHYAAARGEKKNLELELEKGYKFDVANSMGWTPLMMATRKGHMECVKILLAKGADTTRKNKYGATIFLMAVASGNLDLLHLILQQLLSGGVSKQSMESHFSPVTIAVLFNYEHILHYLTEKSFNINAATIKTGLTPAMFAAALENMKFFEILLANGADVNLKNAANQTAENIIKNQMPQTPTVCMQHDTNNLIYTPLPPFMNYNSKMRKSSNLQGYILSPALTPIGLGFIPQVFFPSNFQFPVNSPCFLNPNLELLNMPIEDSMIASPTTSEISPGANIRFQNDEVMNWFGSFGQRN